MSILLKLKEKTDLRSKNEYVFRINFTVVVLILFLLGIVWKAFGTDYHREEIPPDKVWVYTMVKDKVRSYSVSTWLPPTDRNILRIYTKGKEVNLKYNKYDCLFTATKRWSTEDVKYLCNNNLVRNFKYQSK